MNARQYALNIFKEITSIDNKIVRVFSTDKYPWSRKPQFIPSMRLPFTRKNNAIIIKAYKFIKLNVSLKVED